MHAFLCYYIYHYFLLFFDLFKNQGEIFYDIVYALIYIEVILQIINIPIIIRRIAKLDSIAFLSLFFLSLYALGTFTFRHILFVYPYMAVLYVDRNNKYPSSSKMLSYLAMNLFRSINDGTLFVTEKLR